MNQIKKEREMVHRDNKSLAALEYRDEPTYRDNRKKESIELKDYRNRKYNADYVAELEHYNPDKSPLRHILLDVPLWIGEKQNQKSRS